MAGTKPKLDRELLGRVAALTSGQQRWLRTILQSIFTMEAPGGRPAARAAEEVEMREERRPRQAKPRTAKPAPDEEPAPRSQGLDKLLSGEGAAEEEYPELADELKGIGDIADLLREGGRERRRFGEELMRLFGSGETDTEEDEEDEGKGKGARFN